MNASFQERYEAGNSLVHHLDSRVKVLTALLLILGIVLTPPEAWPAYPLLWALIGSLAVVSNIGAWRLARLGGLALPFTLAATTLLFSTPGRPILTIIGLTISDAGSARFAAIVLKSWLSIQVALLLSITTHFTDLLWALSSLHVPETLIAIVGFMYRYLFTLQDEAQRLLRARSARSATSPNQKSGGSLTWRAQVAGGMVGNLFLRSYQRSERVYAAMQSRGYKGQIRALTVTPLTWTAILYGSVPIVALVIIEALAILWWSK